MPSSQHGDAAGDVKAPDAHRQPGRQKRPSEIDGARELVGLHADQPDQRLAAALAKHVDDPVGLDAAIGLIIGVEMNLDTRPEHVAPARVFGEAVEAGEGV